MLPNTRSIATKRLILRKPKISDAREIFLRYAQDEDVTKYLVWKTHKNISETKEYLRSCIVKWGMGEFCFTITKKASQEVIGMIRAAIKSSETRVGYVIAKDEWNKGYMTEALKAIIDFSFSHPKIKKIYAVCDLENEASARVMEKAGLKCEKILKRHLLHPNRSSKKRDVFLYSLSRTF